MVQIFKIDNDFDGIKLNKWFLKNYPSLTKVHLEKLLRKGQIRLNKGRCKSVDTLKKGDELKFPEFVRDYDKPKENKVVKNNVSSGDVEAFKNSIIYQDDSILCINKQAGTACQKELPTDRAYDDIAKAYDAELRLLHRLDRDTSGVLMFAKNMSVAKKFHKIILEKKLIKKYNAIVYGTDIRREGKIDSFLIKNGDRMDILTNQKFNLLKINDPIKQNAKKAITLYKVLDLIPDKFSFLEIIPRTGRKHQIRVHMESLEASIVGDLKYGNRKQLSNLKNENENIFQNHMYLHARSLEFFHPILRKEIKIEAKLPAYFNKVLDYFEIGRG